MATGYKMMQVIGHIDGWKCTGYSKKANPSSNRNDEPIWKKASRKIRHQLKRIDIQEV